ncbi:MAG: VOC family protein [Proteobacteria bacterium]|nr:VOC family protein [Pseudomonadota bacterium]
MSSLGTGKLVQIEIHVSDLAASLAFYEKVFGWKKSPAEIHRYAVLEVPKDCTYGISLVPSSSSISSSSSPILYFSFEDAAEIANLAEKHGGSKRFGPANLPSYGKIWQITDPDGHRFGLFEKDSVKSLN